MQPVVDVYGPQPGVQHPLHIGILLRKTLRDACFPQVGVLFPFAEHFYFPFVDDVVVLTDKCCKCFPVFADAVGPYQRIEGQRGKPGGESALQVPGPFPGESFVYSDGTFGGCSRPKYDAVHGVFVTVENFFHQLCYQGQLDFVVFQRIDNAGFSGAECQSFPVADTDMSFDDAFYIMGRGIGEEKHRRDVVAQRIGGRQGINAAVQPSDFAFEGDEQSATGLRRRNALYITQRDILSGTGYGIRTHPLGQRIAYKTPVTPCGMYRVGPEALQITDVLPVVAPLYPVEQRTPQGNLLQRYPLLIAMQDGAEDDTAAVTLHSARQGYQKIDFDTSAAFGNGT